MFTVEVNRDRGGYSNNIIINWVFNVDAVNMAALAGVSMNSIHNWMFTL